MKTNRYPITSDGLSVKIIMDVVEDLSKKMALDNKKSLQLRLLSEEIFGMANSILDIKKGEFYIEQDCNEYQLTIEASADINEKSREVLMSASTDGENKSYKGVTGKIFQVLDYITTKDDSIGVAPIYITSGYSAYAAGMSSCPVWSLSSSMESDRKAEKSDNWDGLERSILVKLADDVQISVRNSKAKITVIKKFK